MDGGLLASLPFCVEWHDASVDEARSPADTATSQVELVEELSRLVKLGILPIYAVVTQRKAVMEQSWLVKLGLLPCDAAASQNKVAEELSQLMRFSLMPSDTAVSQRNVFDTLVESTTKGAVLPVKKQEAL